MIIAWAVSLLRGLLSSPRAFFSMAIALALLVGGCEIDRRATKRERAKWEARVLEADQRARAEERIAAQQIAEALQAAAKLNQEALDAQRTDTEVLRAELGAAQDRLARCRVPARIVMRLDAGARALPGAPAPAGRAGARTDPAVSRPDRPASQADASQDVDVDPGALLIRARELSGAAERNTERLRACLTAYEAARRAAVGAGGG